MYHIVGAHGHAILVLLERMAGFVMMEKLPYGKRIKLLSKTVVGMLFAYRKYLNPITSYNGSEFSAHLDITVGLRMIGLEDVTVSFSTATAPGRRTPSKTSTNSYANTYPKSQISMTFQTCISRTSQRN